MKKTFSLIPALFAISQVSFCQKDSTRKKVEEKIKQFWMVILKTRPMDKEITDTVRRKEIFCRSFL